MENLKKQMTEKMIIDTLQLWCDNVVATGKVYSDGGDVSAQADKVLSDNYDYDNGKVLFKPTLTFGEQTFRPTKQGAKAYFIGNDKNFPNDKGFKLKPWTKVWFTDVDFLIQDNLGIVQCNVHLIGADGSQIFVNKSFVLKVCDDNRIRIVLHHSSLPFNPES